MHDTTRSRAPALLAIALLLAACSTGAPDAPASWPSASTATPRLAGCKEGIPVCAPRSSDQLAITMTREEWDDVRTMFDNKAPANDPPGVEHLFEVWRQVGLLDEQPQ